MAKQSFFPNYIKNCIEMAICYFHLFQLLLLIILYLAVKLMYIKNIFTAELILIFSLVIDISRYFHCRVWVTSDVSIHLTSLNVPHFRNSNAYNSGIYKRKHKVWVFIFLVRTLGTMWYQNCLCFQNFLVFAFSPPAL